MKRYLWCEDSASGFQFWQAVFRVIHPDIEVVSKKGNTELVKATKNIDDDNQYFIIIDTATDNQNVIRENKRLYSNIKEKENVAVIEIHSFEFALLSFKLLEQWVFAEKDDLKEKRKDFLAYRKVFVDLYQSEGTAEALSVLRDIVEKYKEYNSEQIAAKLLFEITRNTGFQTDKGELGKCFVNDCCTWMERQEDDICGLDDNRIDAKEKIRILIDQSVLKEAFRKVDL